MQKPELQLTEEELQVLLDMPVIYGMLSNMLHMRKKVSPERVKEIARHGLNLQQWKGYNR